ncbi:tetratricopeptide repeat protein [Microcystis aeruginosa]|uniref:tetratricopeptide repeat protein n=1 Tax=Microcystis aeruginosa TaxID=1126 RepID=UPI002330155C|nr:tetratricopeptide repeat protein [Microcystis aeruginosa]MDB9412513.1 tetratricopeptide repeat protein [Microcystis aeruginosa CS-567/02]
MSSAEEDYQRALSLNPDDAEAHFNLGLLYEELQDFDLARKEYIAFLIHKRYILDPEQLNQQRFNCAAQMRETLYISYTRG